MPVAEPYTKINHLTTDHQLTNLALDFVAIARSEPFVRAHQLIEKQLRRLMAEQAKSLETIRNP